MRYSNTPKRIVRLTESDLTRIIRRVIREQEETKLLADELKNIPGGKLTNTDMKVLRDNGVIFVEKMQAPQAVRELTGPDGKPLEITHLVKYKEKPEGDVRTLIISAGQKPMGVSKTNEGLFIVKYGTGGNPFGKGVYVGPKVDSMELVQLENVLSKSKELMAAI